MKKFNGIFVCLALFCFLVTCATNQSQDAVSEIDTTETAVSVLVPLEPDTELALVVEPELVLEPEPEPVAEPEPIPEPIPDPVPAGFVRIEGGSFTKGSPANELGRQSREIQRQVTISSFFMGIYPVTVNEFSIFVNETNYITDVEKTDGGYINFSSLGSPAFGAMSKRIDANFKNPYFIQDDNHPVVLVTWFDAIHYCNWLSIQNGFMPVYTIDGTNVTWNRDANGYRLPTEAEWEYACRAGTTTPFNTGENITTDQANYNGNRPYNNNDPGEYRIRTTPVGTFSANPWGLYDMHGNVWEWCWDWLFTEGVLSLILTDPIGPANGSQRVVRGGSWISPAQSLRSAFIFATTPSTGINDYGFRVVRNAE